MGKLFIYLIASTTVFLMAVEGQIKKRKVAQSMFRPGDGLIPGQPEVHPAYDKDQPLQSKRAAVEVQDKPLSVKSTSKLYGAGLMSGQPDVYGHPAYEKDQPWQSEEAEKYVQAALSRPKYGRSTRTSTYAESHGSKKWEPYDELIEMGFSPEDIDRLSRPPAERSYYNF